MRFTAADYAELLAMYLGDGCLSGSARTYRLRIALDLKYATIIREGEALLRRCFPYNRVGTAICGRGTWVNVSVYSSHLPCLFPQHGPGPKHRRVIVLEPWQARLVQAAPWSFIRGCIRTDGCCFINRTGPYEYLSYAFSNRSEDIVRLFADACRQVNVATRVNYWKRRGAWDVRINQRASVAQMLEEVGTKT